MILLDSNYLIRVLPRNSGEANRVSQWLRDGHEAMRW